MPRTDRASRVVSAPRQQVYAALVDAEALASWLPPVGMMGRIEWFDPRPGGSYRMVLTYADPSVSRGKSTPDADVVEARFIELVPSERVVYSVDFVSEDPAFAGPMMMTWALALAGVGTRVDITADNVADVVSPEDHAAGLAPSLANLAAYVEQ